MSEPTVDIGISVFRRGQFIAELIESVLDQSYQHWRLTIAEDDGPSDAVARAVEPYLQDVRIEYRPEPVHLGVTSVKTRLIERGEGKYVAIPDDDDRWLPGWLERRVEVLERNPECVLAWGGHIDIDSDGAELRRSPLEICAGVHSSREFIERMLHRNIVAAPSAMFRRDAYERAGGRLDDRLIQIWDYALWTALGMLGPVAFLDVHDSCYRCHPAQISLLHNRAVDHLLLFEELDTLLERHHPDLRSSAAAFRREKAARLLSVALDAAEAGDRRSAARHVASAARLAPGALASVRGVAALTTALGGRQVSRRIGALRS